MHRIAMAGLLVGVLAAASGSAHAEPDLGAQGQWIIGADRLSPLLSYASVIGLPRAGDERQYVPSCVPIQIRLRSHSTNTFSVVPRHQRAGGVRTSAVALASSRIINTIAASQQVPRCSWIHGGSSGRAPMDVHALHRH